MRIYVRCSVCDASVYRNVSGYARTMLRNRPTCGPTCAAVLRSGTNLKGNSFAYYLGAAQKRLEKTFDLDERHLVEVWAKQDGKCALSNVPIVLRGFNSRSFPTTASLDRIDSSKGYVRGNVQFVAYSINLAKNTFDDKTMHEFLDLIRGTVDVRLTSRRTTCVAA